MPVSTQQSCGGQKELGMSFHLPFRLLPDFSPISAVIEIVGMSHDRCSIFWAQVGRRILYLDPTLREDPTMFGLSLFFVTLAVFYTRRCMLPVGKINYGSRTILPDLI